MFIYSEVRVIVKARTYFYYRGFLCVYLSVGKLLNVEHFAQCLGALHSKHWSNFLSCFLKRVFSLVIISHYHFNSKFLHFIINVSIEKLSHS